MATKLKIGVDKGKIALGQEKLDEVVSHLNSGEYIVSFHLLFPKTPEEWKKYYFLLRDILYEDGETGYTKTELHEIGKATIGVESTKGFTSEQWQQYVQDFKDWAFESFECYL